MNANAKELFKKLQPLIALIVMVVAMALLSDKFLTLTNQRNILLQISVNRPGTRPGGSPGRRAGR